MKRSSFLGLILLLSFIAVIGFVALNSKAFVEAYIRGASGYAPSKAVEETLQTIKQTYTSFQKALDMAMNPWKYMYEVESAQVAPDVPKDISGFEFVSINSISPAALFKCANQKCNDVIIPDVPIIFSVRYSFLRPTEVQLNCEVKTTYDECFEKSCDLSTNKIFGQKGFLSKKAIIKLKFNKSIDTCHSCPLTASDCESYPVVFKDYGFRADVSIKAKFSAESNTTYRALITTDKILGIALSDGISVYNLLDLDPNNYDIAYYKGLIGYPKVDISRLGKKYNYPILLFENEESYDVLLFAISPFNNIISIKNLQIYIYKPKGVDLKFLGEGCESTYDNSVTVDGKELFGIHCSDKGEYYKCNVNIDDNFINWYKSRYDPYSFKFVIPICLKNNGMQGDYSNLLIKAFLEYEYQIAASTTIVYTPYYDVSIQ